MVSKIANTYLRSAKSLLYKAFLPSKTYLNTYPMTYLNTKL